MLTRPHRPSEAVTIAAEDRAHATAVGNILRALYRRRVLVLLPVVLLTPLVLVVSNMLPETYIARTLLLLQETQPESPLARERLSSVDQVSQKGPAIEALVRSDYILQQVVDRLPQAPSAIKPSQFQRAVLVKSLRDAVSVAVIGSDFVEIRLQGASPEGLGARLSDLTSVLLETMLSQPSRSNAVDFVLKTYQRQVADAVAAREAIEAQVTKVADSASPSQTLTNVRLREAEALVAERTQALEAISERYRKTSEAGNLGLLFQPQRIVVLDPPSDPYFAKYPKWLFVATGLVTTVFLGLVLVFFAESFDTRVRDMREIEGLARAPVVAVLPAYVSRRGRLGYASLRSVLAILLIVALAIALALAAKAGLLPVEKWMQRVSIIEIYGG